MHYQGSVIIFVRSKEIFNVGIDKRVILTSILEAQ
jgi:hypothetical protein